MCSYSNEPSPDQVALGQPRPFPPVRPRLRKRWFAQVLAQAAALLCVGSRGRTNPRRVKRRNSPYASHDRSLLLYRSQIFQPELLPPLALTRRKWASQGKKTLIPPGSIPRGLPRKEFRLGCSIPRSLLRGCSFLTVLRLDPAFAGQRRLDAPNTCHTCPHAVEFPIRDAGSGGLRSESSSLIPSFAAVRWRMSETRSRRP